MPDIDVNKIAEELAALRSDFDRVKSDAAALVADPTIHPRLVAIDDFIFNLTGSRIPGLSTPTARR